MHPSPPASEGDRVRVPRTEGPAILLPGPSVPVRGKSEIRVRHINPCKQKECQEIGTFALRLITILTRLL